MAKRRKELKTSPWAVYLRSGVHTVVFVVGSHFSVLGPLLHKS